MAAGAEVAPRGRARLALFSITIFAGAWQLFLVQPIVARLLLPRLGGSPSVWIGCVLFFQAVLLAAYAYAHLLTTRLSGRVQAGVHLALVAAAAVVLPLRLPSAWEVPSGAPLNWLMGVLALSVGAPFFALATTGPLVQRWFAAAGHPRSRDPYFLFAASNLGSIGALIAYPLVVEPWAGLTRQRLAWSAGYAAWALLVAGCAMAALWRRAPTAPRAPDKTAPAIPGRDRLRWLLLAAVPSSLVLGATQYVTTDLASFPLLWVVPLALYLLSFVLSFSPSGGGPPVLWGAVLAVLAAAAALSFWAMTRPYAWLLVTLHPLIVLAAGMVCHGRLARERPPAARLTEYYLVIAAGGALGAGVNAVAAPLIFPAVIEYPLALVIACFLRPGAWPSGAKATALDVAGPLALGAGALALERFTAALGVRDALTLILVQAALPCGAALLFARRRLGFALALAVLILVGARQTAIAGDVVFRERTFFGVHRVVERPGPPFRVTDAQGIVHDFRVRFRMLYHGSTRHGMQALDENLRLTPTSYYHRTGPVGAIFGPDASIHDVAVVGLGAGTLAAYGAPERRFTFYELDPAVARIARDPRWFTFLADGGSQSEVVLGDGRLMIGRAPAASYDLVVVDAFSSDAIPIHLITREAVATYLRALRPGGLLALHITNQNLDLAPVVNAIATDLGLSGLMRDDSLKEPRELIEGKDPSTWAVLSRDPQALARLAADPRWASIPWSPGRRAEPRYLWTDEASNIVAILSGF